MTLCHCVITCRVYIPYPFQWGSPTFHAGEAFAMMAASFVSLFEVHFWTTISCISCLLASYSATKFSNLLLKAETSLQQIMHLNSDFWLTLWIWKTYFLHHPKVRDKERPRKILVLIFPFHLQSTGTFFATARYGSATPVPPSVIGRGVGWLVGCVYVTFHLHIMILSSF